MMPRLRRNTDPAAGDTSRASGCSRACCSWGALRPSPGAEGPLQHRGRLQAESKGTQQPSWARCVYVCRDDRGVCRVERRDC